MARSQAFPGTVARSARRSLGRTETAATPLHLRARHVDVERWLGGYVRQRAGRRLGKHSRHIQRATVRFTDVNGPKRGVDIECRLTILLEGASPILVEARGTGPREAFDKALNAAEVALTRALERQNRRRPRQRVLRRAPPSRID